ncbi:hypothetical protein GXP67_05495 [Rhodocytophaga rosea]|uniref:Uncharacterized protein n=1 Tax=Rhodocytophaga rosea TaxID=2704465 RepID=A0A6C0GER3_9BACT|nr:hypothetical protein [Rhodocytophaga rosea]QHT66160.1 hypothetical protein GXP67_05495 [Rhodocytophaga rosea]
MKSKKLKLFNPSDIEELKSSLVSDQKFLKGIWKLLAMILVATLFLTYIPVEGWPVKSWDEYMIKFIIVLTPFLLLFLSFWQITYSPLYQRVKQTQSDLALMHKWTFVTTVMGKTIDEKNQSVTLTTTEQEEFTIDISEQEDYTVGDQIYVELTQTSNLPLKIERVKIST